MHRQSFSYTHRICRSSTFKLIFEQGKVTKGQWLNLWFLAQAGLEKSLQGPKLGIVVSRKTSPKATERNRWKRLIREAFRQRRRVIKKDTLVLIPAKRGRECPSYSELEKEIDALLEKAQLLEG